MTERHRDRAESKADRDRKRRKVGAGVLAAGLTVFGVAKCGPGVVEGLRGDPSLIVAGAPGQVEGRRTDFANWGKGNTRVDYLLVEQCPVDVENAKDGRHTESFNPDTGEYNPGCNLDWVRVDGQTASIYGNGSAIVFSGEPGEELAK